MVRSRIFGTGQGAQMLIFHLLEGCFLDFKLMYFIYILHSNDLDKYYVGQSIDPWHRLIQHNNNPSDRYTGKAKDWKLMAVFKVSESRSEAMKLEKFIESLIDKDSVFSGLLAQLVRVPHVRD